MRQALARPTHYLLLLALLAASMVFSAAPAWACHGASATAATSTADGFTFEARFSTGGSGNTGIGVSSTAGTATWRLIDSYPDGSASTLEPSSHGVGQGVRVFVTGLQPGQSSSVTVSAFTGTNSDCTGSMSYTLSRTVPGSASMTSGTAPTFSDVSRTAEGFTATITNFDADASYTLTASEGAVSRTGDTFTVTGLAPASDATVNVQVAKAGHTTASDSLTGTSMATGTAPTFSDVSRTAEGFTATITNFDADASYTLTASEGAVSRTGDTFTVTGLAPASDATVNVQVAKAGHTTVSDSLTGTSMPVPTPLATGELPRLAASDSLVLLDGQAHSVRVLTTDDSVQIRGDGFSITVAAMGPDGEPANLTPGGHLRFERGQHAYVHGEGFAADTHVAVWLFSTPILLGELDVQSDGTFEGLLPINVDIKPGEHTLQANGVTDDGSKLSASIGVFVDAEEEVTPVPVSEPAATSEPLPATGGSLQGLLTLGLGLLLAGMFGLKLTRRRPVM